MRRNFYVKLAVSGEIMRSKLIPFIATVLFTVTGLGVWYLLARI